MESGQCPYNSFCSRVEHKCICASPYKAVRKQCTIIHPPGHEEDSNGQLQNVISWNLSAHLLIVPVVPVTPAVQIYRITLIFASCCLALVLIMFLVCIVRKSYWPSSQSERQRRRRSSSSMQIAVAEVGAGIPFNIRPPYEKPPSYEESQRNMITLMGTPPPEYPQQLIPIFGEERLAEAENQIPVSGSSGTSSQVQVRAPVSNQESGIRNPAFQPD